MKLAAALIAAVIAAPAIPVVAWAGPLDGYSRAEIVETIGALTVAPQLCGVAVDRDKLSDVADLHKGAYDVEFHPDIFRVNQRLTKEVAGWDAARLAGYCAAAAALADRLGVAGGG